MAFQQQAPGAGNVYDSPTSPFFDDDDDERRRRRRSAPIGLAWCCCCFVIAFAMIMPPVVICTTTDACSSRGGGGGRRPPFPPPSSTTTTTTQGPTMAPPTMAPPTTAPPTAAPSPPPPPSPTTTSPTPSPVSCDCSNFIFVNQNESKSCINETIITVEYTVRYVDQRAPSCPPLEKSPGKDFLLAWVARIESGTLFAGNVTTESTVNPLAVCSTIIDAFSCEYNEPLVAGDSVVLGTFSWTFAEGLLVAPFDPIVLRTQAGVQQEQDTCGGTNKVLTPLDPPHCSGATRSPTPAPSTVAPPPPPTTASPTSMSPAPTATAPPPPPPNDCCPNDPFVYVGSPYASAAPTLCGTHDYNCDGFEDELACCLSDMVATNNVDERTIYEVVGSACQNGAVLVANAPEQVCGACQDGVVVPGWACESGLWKKKRYVPPCPCDDGPVAVTPYSTPSIGQCALFVDHCIEPNDGDGEQCCVVVAQ